MEMKRSDWEVYAILRRYAPEKARGTLSRLKLRNRVRSVPFVDQGALKWRDVTCFSEDTLLEKAFVPYHLTQLEWEDLLGFVWVDPPRSPYDRTGRRFSTRLARYEVPGGTWVYHWTSLDV